MAPAKTVGLHRLGWLVLTIVIANFAFATIALQVFGKSGFAIVPIVRGGMAVTTLGMATGWWLIAHKWDERFLVSRPAGVLVLLLPVWTGLGFYYDAPIGYIASDTFFLLHATAFIFLFHTYFRRAWNNPEVDSTRMPLGQNFWFAIPMWLIVVGIMGFVFPVIQLPFSIGLLIAVGVLGLIITARRPLAGLLGSLLVLTYAAHANRAFLLAVATATLCSLVIIRRARMLRVVVAVLLVGGIAVGIADTVGWNFSGQNRRITELWTSLQDVTDGRPIEELPVPLYQRIYEAKLVTQQIGAGGIVPVLFGFGSGASMDMSTSTDQSVADASLLGIGSVHNIHLLPYMILFRYGIVGLVLMGLLVLSLIKQMIISRRRYLSDGSHLGILLASIYVLCWLVFAFPAGGFLFENPLVYVCVAAVWASPTS